MGVPVLALFRENKIRESQYYCHSQNLNPSKFMPYTVSRAYRATKRREARGHATNVDGEMLSDTLNRIYNY